MIFSITGINLREQNNERSFKFGIKIVDALFACVRQGKTVV